LHSDNDLVHGHGVFLHPALVGASVRDLQVGQADGGVVLAGVVLHEGHPVLQPRATAIVDVVVIVGQELGVESRETGQGWSWWGDPGLLAEERKALPSACLALPALPVSSLPCQVFPSPVFPDPARLFLPYLDYPLPCQTFPVLPALLGFVWSFQALLCQVLPCPARPCLSFPGPACLAGLRLVHPSPACPACVVGWQLL